MRARAPLDQCSWVKLAEAVVGWGTPALPVRLRSRGGGGRGGCVLEVEWVKAGGAVTGRGDCGDNPWWHANQPLPCLHHPNPPALAGDRSTQHGSPQLAALWPRRTPHTAPHAATLYKGATHPHLLALGRAAASSLPGPKMSAMRRHSESHSRRSSSSASVGVMYLGRRSLGFWGE